MGGAVISPDGETAFSVSLDDGLIDSAYASRYVRELTCGEREQYRVEPLCSAQETTG